MKFIQALAMLLTASFSYVAACAWNNVIQAQVGGTGGIAAKDIPFDVACTTRDSCPRFGYDRIIGSCSDPSIDLSGRTDGCQCVPDASSTKTFWIGRPCTNREKTQSWLVTLGWIFLLYFGLWQALGMLLAVGEREVRHGNSPFKVLFYAKLFELFSNAAGFIVAFAILNSCRASIRSDTAIEKVYYIVITMAACILLTFFMQNVPKKVLSRRTDGGCWNISKKGWTSDREVRMLAASTA
jgi:hypothetical protein